MKIDKNITQTIPVEDIETVSTFFINFNENYYKSPYWAWLSLNDNLSLSNKLDITIQGYVAKLPRNTTAGFNLNANMFSRFIGSNNVVVWNIASESSRNETATRKLSRYKVFPSLPDKFITSSCCHDLSTLKIIPTMSLFIESLTPECPTLSGSAAASFGRPRRHPARWTAGWG